MSIGEVFFTGLVLLIFLAGSWAIGAQVNALLKLTGWGAGGIYALVTWLCAWVFMEVVSA